MNILVISDLHLGNGDEFGTFGWQVSDFIRTLENIRKENQIQQVILNGDIFELYKYTLNDVKSHNKELLEYFKKNNFIFIRGNHDFLNREARDFYLIENSEGKKIFIEHGHQAKMFFGLPIGSFFARLGFTVLGKLTMFKFFLKIYFKVLEFEEELNRIPRKYNSYGYLKYALRLLRKYDVVILGHTHKIETHHTYFLNQKKRYLNCGSCSLGRFQAVVLDTETLKYDTIKENFYKKANKIPHKELNSWAV